MSATYIQSLNTPIGPLTLSASGGHITRVHFTRLESTSESCEVLDDALAELAEYFAGAKQALRSPVLAEGTEFQREVWTAVTEIPYGRTSTYFDIAQRIGRPKAVRAVGAANGANPIPIFIPCHRVIGRSGGLTGYAGGLDAKTQLLRLEGALLI